jgi:hypothetical protein
VRTLFLVKNLDQVAHALLGFTVYLAHRFNGFRIELVVLAFGDLDGYNLRDFILVLPALFLPMARPGPDGIAGKDHRCEHRRNEAHAQEGGGGNGKLRTRPALDEEAPEELLTGVEFFHTESWSHREKNNSKTKPFVPLFLERLKGAGVSIILIKLI